MTTAFITHSDCLLHNMGAYHPERPERLRAVEDQLTASGLMGHLQHEEAPLARNEHLERVHAPRYIAWLEQSTPKSGLIHLDPDTAMNPHTLRAALRAAGAAVEQYWMPALEAFKPELLFVSAGFDAHRDDDMAMLKLVESDYAWVTRKIKDVADRYAGGRIVSALEGGYELHALGRCVMTHLKVIGGL